MTVFLRCMFTPKNHQRLLFCMPTPGMLRMFSTAKETTDCPSVSSLILNRRFHIIMVMWHKQFLNSITTESLLHRFNHPVYPFIIWLRSIDVIVYSANITIHSACRKANDRMISDVSLTEICSLEHATAEDRQMWRVSKFGGKKVKIQINQLR